LVLDGADVCAICGRPLDPEAPARSRWASSVDHIAPLKAMRGLDAAEQRQLALDPANLRAVHVGCNTRRENVSRRRGGRVLVHTSRGAGEW
jgi:5-methylcytosine-specific restriction endonuclease McrA